MPAGDPVHPGARTHKKTPEQELRGGSEADATRRAPASNWFRRRSSSRMDQAGFSIAAWACMRAETRTPLLTMGPHRLSAFGEADEQMLDVALACRAGSVGQTERAPRSQRNDRSACPCGLCHVVSRRSAWSDRFSLFRRRESPVPSSEPHDWQQASSQRGCRCRGAVSADDRALCMSVIAEDPADPFVPDDNNMGTDLHLFKAERNDTDSSASNGQLDCGRCLNFRAVSVLVPGWIIWMLCRLASGDAGLPEPCPGRGGTRSS